jgi:hypothetical protein
MLIKSVIKAYSQRLIVVILRSLEKQGLCYIWFTINTLWAFLIFQTQTVSDCIGTKKISYEQK